jgi:hypothetical protein
MAFSEDIILKAYSRSKGYCECNDVSHNHHNHKCDSVISFEKEGKRGWGGYKAVKIDRNGRYTYENCILICWKCFIKITNQKTEFL